jgi:ABC-type iron transport system FetAB permease component
MQAARYQIAIMCAIGGATALAATSATFFAARQLVDKWVMESSDTHHQQASMFV